MYRSKNKITPMLALMCYIASVLLLTPSSALCFDSDQHYAVVLEQIACFSQIRSADRSDETFTDTCCAPLQQDAACCAVTAQGTTLKSNTRISRSNLHFGAEKYRPVWPRGVSLDPGKRMFSTAQDVAGIFSFENGSNIVSSPDSTSILEVSVGDWIVPEDDEDKRK